MDSSAILRGAWVPTIRMRDRAPLYPAIARRFLSLRTRGMARAAMGLCLIVGSACSPMRDGDAPHVRLPQGTYRARPAEAGVIAFLGIPYARAPIGALRWQEAQPPIPTASTIDATEFGPSCRQAIDSVEVASLWRQDEDCLSVNVWTRAGGGPPRPVMVWLHGGANVSGGTADPLYAGHHLVRDNEVVFVSVNYRLGPFGFLDLSAVGGTAMRRSRNLGLLDQLAALRWVRAHIGAFGGDSNNITIFGESAGGSAVMRLLAMPAARGLFDKAIIQSGGPANIAVKGYPKSDDIGIAQALAHRFMREAGTPDLAALQALPGDSVLAVAARVARAGGDRLGVSTWGARVDGEVLPTDIFGDIWRGVNPDVPVLIGTNEDEMLYFGLYDPDFERNLMREYHEKGTAMGRDFSRVRATADRFTGGSNDPRRYVEFAGEFWLRQPSIILAEGQSRHANVFMYLFAWDSKVPGLGASHAMEIPFVFGHLGPEVASLTGPQPPATLSGRIQSAWVAFATSGDPSVAGEPRWPRYRAGSRATMRLVDGPWTVEFDPQGDARRLLRPMFDVPLPFDTVAPGQRRPR